MKKLISLILAAVMLVAAAVAVSADGAPFSDVKEKRWSYDSIVYAYEKGYMDGVGGGKFDPAGTMTRGMVVTVLYRMEDKLPVVFEDAFTDVKSGKYYSDAVIWARNNSIVNGVSEGKFDPGGKITREQLATMLYRYAEFKGLDTMASGDLTKFPDADKAHSYAKGALAWATGKGLITGVKSGDKDMLDPRGNATREQFATILMRFCEADLETPLEYNKPVPISQYTEPEYPLVDDADVYVATDGDDGNPGTLDAPVRTFERARDLVREKKATATDEIVVAFKAGEYGALDGLALTSEDSGTEAVPIRYCKYGDGDVTFNNGVTLRKDDFEPLSAADEGLFPVNSRSNILKLNLDEYFPDGMPEGLAIFGGVGMIWEARYPNKYEGNDDYVKNAMLLPPEYQREYCVATETGWNYYGMEVTILPPLSSRILNKVNHLEGMKMTGYIMYGWRVDTFHVQSYDKSTYLLTIDETRLPSDFWSAGIRTPQMTLDQIYFENTPDFLDAEGEYWYDTDTNTIYFYDPCDEYSIGLGGNFLTLDDADYVSLVGLSFCGSRDGNSVFVRNSDHVTVDRCNFRGVYRPIEATGASDYFTVTRCEFSRFVSNCIALRQSGHRTTLESNHVVIDNNYIHDWGLSKIFNNQAIADGTIGAQISHNVFENSANGAINLGMLSIIEYNVFDNMMTSTQDFGAIYTWNAVSSARHNTIRYNLMGTMGKMGGGAFGIYMDDFTQDQYIYGNLFYDSSLMLHNARDQFIHDNIFVKSDLSTSGFGFFYEDINSVEPGLLPDGTGWEDLYNRYYNQRVNEGEEGYEIWKATFPSLYAFTPDVENPYHYESIFCPWDCIHDNAFIEKGYNVNQPAKDYGEVYDNVVIPGNENPLFVNPTLGDYTLKEGVGYDMPFEQMGRY